MNTRDKILNLFTSMRENANASYDEEHLLEYLIIPNGRNLDNSFKGKRYKIRFIDTLQTTFAVCFPNDFYDKNWTLDGLSAYIDARSKQHTANLKMAQKRLARSKSVDAVIPICILLLAPLSVLEGYSFWIYAVMPIALCAFVMRFKLGDISYHKNLLATIEKNSLSVKPTR